MSGICLKYSRKKRGDEVHGKVLVSSGSRLWVSWLGHKVTPKQELGGHLAVCVGGRRQGWGRK